MNSELFLTGVGILALLATWKWVWMPTALDCARDRLFDLRDVKLRNFFLENGRTLDDPYYLKLRGLVNGHLRHTESLTIWEFAFTMTRLRNKQKLHAMGSRVIENRFKTDDATLAQFIGDFRMNCILILLLYMVETSIIGAAFAIFLHCLANILSSFIKSGAKIKRLMNANPHSSAGLAMESFALA